MRTADERIAAVLEKHLLNDPEPVVRGRIAEELELRMQSEFFDLFLRAISDPSPMVQAPALLSFGNAMGKLSDEQTQTLRRLAGERALSEDQEVRAAALYLVEEYVAQWAKKAREAALKANLSEADSLLGVAVAYAPASKQARYYQGKFYFDYMEREHGIKMLRTHRLLVDVPKLESPPTIDGLLGDEAWEGAARIDSFYVHGSTRTTNPPQVQTHVVMGYSDTALYWGAHCFDAHPESLVVLPFEDEAPFKLQDVMMFRLDRNLDTKVAQMFVNTLGLQRDRGYSDTALYWGAHCFDAHPESLVVLPFEDEAPFKLQDVMMFRLDRNLDTKVAQMFVNTLGLQRDSWNDFEDWAWA